MSPRLLAIGVVVYRSHVGYDRYAPHGTLSSRPGDRGVVVGFRKTEYTRLVVVRWESGAEEYTRADKLRKTPPCSARKSIRMPTAGSTTC